MRNNNALVDLLTQTGMRLRGTKRGDCPRCRGRRTISFTDECFYCHKCGWSGNAQTLARELGMEQRRETQEERRQRQIVRREAEEFVEWASRRRIEAAALLRTLDRADIDCRELGRQELETNGEVSERTWRLLELAWLWAERAEQTWGPLFDFEKHAGQLYGEFLRKREAA